MRERPLYEALEELRAARDDLKRASYRTFEGIFARYAALLRPGTPLGDTLEKVLPPVDFESFWKAGAATIGGMAGNGKLDFPPQKPARVAMQRDLMIRMADGDPTIHNVTYQFFYSGRSFSDHRVSFVSQVIEPFQRDLAGLVSPYLQEEKFDAAKPAQVAVSSQSFVDPERIGRFRELDKEVDFDLRKLIKLCEEANLSYGNRAWHSVSFVTRTILNHIPPALGHSTFEQVAAHASPKHFKVAATFLDSFARNVADFHLHETLSESLALANETQVNASQQLDVVLGEVERALAARITAKGKTP